MAPQSKKNSKKPLSPKTRDSKKTASPKSVSKKTNSQKRRTQKRSYSWQKGLFTLLGLFLIISIITFAYFLGDKKERQNSTTTKVQSSKKKESKPKIVKKREVSKSNKTKAVQRTVPLTLAKGKKAKLVIIIDDVHTRGQIDAIRNLSMKITPSVFPPYKISPNSHLLVRGLEHYMIHLPMESGNKKLNTQYKTLKVSFSNKKIENRIKELRILFPKAKYINNHTGSVFTSNYAAMHLAYKVMKENGFIFVDSKTISSSKVREIAHAYGDVYLSRDVFIDNVHSITAIHKQLVKAVNLAKRKGYVIAIGHPHAVTMEALASADEILKEVELVYMDELYQ